MNKESFPPDSKPPTRRKFLRRTAAGCLLGGVGALGYACGIEPHWIDVVQRTLPIANLPDELNGKRIVQLSDIHVGEDMDNDFLLESFADLAQQQPDLIVLTGDFMTCYETEQIDPTLEIMQHLPPAPLGHVAVLGNHDYGRMGTVFHTARQLTQGLRDLGITVLRNEVFDVAGLQLAGLDEVLLHQCRVEPTLAQLDPGRAMLALCHNPDGVDLDGWQNFQGWILSGHTHGGQCRFPGFDPPITPVHNKRYTAGVFELSGNRKLYINRGLGYYHRIRFNCRPEITVFMLERTKAV